VDIKGNREHKGHRGDTRGYKGHSGKQGTQRTEGTQETQGDTEGQRQKPGTGKKPIRCHMKEMKPIKVFMQYKETGEQGVTWVTMDNRGNKG